MTVTESKPGTKPSAEEQAKVASSEKGKTPGSAGKVSSEETLLYTQKQADALIHAAKSETGRQVKTLETERDSLKSQIVTKENEIEDTKAERETLQKQIEELTGDDPKKFDLIQKDKDLRERERTLKANTSALETKEQAHGERIKKAEALEVEVLILEVVEDYEDAEAEKLSSLCSTLEASSEEQIRKVADTLWTKKVKEPDNPLKPYPGYTLGGAKDLSNETADETLKRGFSELKKK